MSPPKFPRTYHWPSSPQVHQDDSYHENPEIFVGPQVVIEEKIDGGNTCLCAGQVYARSTGQPADEPWFAMVKKWHAWKTIDLDPNTAVYGEDIFGVHSIEYDPVMEDETFRMFGLREGDYWYSVTALRNFAATFGFFTAPILFEGTFSSVKEITKWMDDRITGPSMLGPTIEGFVIRFEAGFFANEYQLKTAKYVRKNHVQADDPHWRVNWKPCRFKPSLN